MQTKLYIQHVAFTLDPIFFVASHYGVASPLPTLYWSLLHWRAPLPCRFSIVLECRQIFHQADGIVGVRPIMSLWFLQLSSATAESGGRCWDARYVCVNVKTAIDMYCFQNLWEQQQYRSSNNGQAMGSNGMNNGCNGVNYSSRTGVEWLNNGWNNGYHWQYNGSCCI